MIMMITVAEDGKKREQSCLHRRSIPKWLSEIHPLKVAPENRPKLAAWRTRSASVLADLAYREGVFARPEAGAQLDRPIADSQLVSLVGTVMQTINNLLQEQAKVQAEANAKVLARLSLMESRSVAAESALPPGVVGDAGAERLKACMIHIARTRNPNPKAFSSERGKVDGDLRRHINYPGLTKACHLKWMPMEKYGEAIRWLAKEQVLADEIAKKRSADEQLSMFKKN